MSWKSISLVQARVGFVKLALKAQQSFAEVCRIFRISRKTGYKWKRRFLRQGLGGLRDRSRRPKGSPPSDPGWLVAADPTFAAPTSALGSKETPGTVASSILPSTGSGGTNDHVVVAAMEVDPPPTRSAAPRPAVAAPETDGTDAVQSGVDGRFQRLVPNGRRPTGRTVDGAGFVQPVHFGGPAVDRSAMVACSSGLCAVVRPVWLAESDSGGQWWPLWIQRSSRSVALERLVDGVGNPSGIYRAGTSRTKRRSRANAPGNEGRCRGSGFERPAGAATTNRSLGPTLQSGASSRSVGTANPRRVLPPRAMPDLPETAALEISAVLEGAQRTEQRTGSVAGAASICGRGVCRVESGLEASGGGKTNGLFGWSAFGRVAHSGRLWTPACGVCPQASYQTQESVTYVFAS